MLATLFVRGDRSLAEGRVSLGESAAGIQRGNYNAASMLLKSSVEVGRREQVAVIYSVDTQSKMI